MTEKKGGALDRTAEGNTQQRERDAELGKRRGKRYFHGFVPE